MTDTIKIVTVRSSKTKNHNKMLYKMGQQGLKKIFFSSRNTHKKFLKKGRRTVLTFS